MVKPATVCQFFLVSQRSGRKTNGDRESAMKTFVDAQIKHAPSNVKPRRARRETKPLVTLATIAFVGFLASIACAVPSFAQIVGTVQLNIERRGHTATLLEDGKVL